MILVLPDSARGAQGVKLAPPAQFLTDNVSDKLAAIAFACDGVHLTGQLPRYLDDRPWSSHNFGWQSAIRSSILPYT